jgi:DNA repair protein RecO (recombination protein O)
VAAGPQLQTTAVVLSTLDYGDADRIVRLLTPDKGRVSALARRARARQPRFGGALDVGNRTEVTLRAGRGSLWFLNAAKLQDGRAGAHQDLSLLSLLAYACELCGGLAREDSPEPRLYGLLDTAATLLDAMTAPPGGAFRVGLEAKALTFAGFTPVLTRCAVCSDTFQDTLEPGDSPRSADPMAFHAAAGGAVHRRCDAQGTRVSHAWLQAIEHARRTPLRELVDKALPTGPSWALAQAAENQLGRALKSRSVLASLLPTTDTDTVAP